jgi:hypothetical protein
LKRNGKLRYSLGNTKFQIYSFQSPIVDTNILLAELISSRDTTLNINYTVDKAAQQ